MLKRSIHGSRSTNCMPAVCRSKPVYSGIVTRKPGIAPTSAIQRCARRVAGRRRRRAPPARPGSAPRWRGESSGARHRHVPRHITTSVRCRQDAEEHHERVLVDQARSGPGAPRRRTSPPARAEPFTITPSIARWSPPFQKPRAERRARRPRTARSRARRSRTCARPARRAGRSACAIRFGRSVRIASTGTRPSRCRRAPARTAARSRPCSDEAPQAVIASASRCCVPGDHELSPK